MRILLVTHYYSTHRGGVEAVAHRLAEELCSRHGFSLQWFASDCDALPQTRASTLSLHPVEACNASEKWAGLPWPIWWSPAGLAGLWRAVGWSECVHIHDYIYFGSLCAFSMALMRGRPVLLTQHIGSVPYENALFRLALSVLNHTVGRAVLTCAARVVFVSAHVMEYFASYCNFRMPPELIRNGVDHKTFGFGSRSDQTAARALLGIDAFTPAFLFVGRFSAMKGLPLLRHLAERNPDILWLLAGHGAEDPSSWGLRNVRVFRDKTGPSLAQVYRSADLVVLPSRSEGFPLVIQEAMSCGTPVLGAKEWMDPQVELAHRSFSEPVLAPDAPARWNARVKAMAADVESLRAMRSDVAGWSSEIWSWQRCGERYAELLRSLTHRPLRISAGN